MFKPGEMLARSPLWQQLQVRYEAMSPSDRRALQWLVGFLAAACLYLLVWEPVRQWNEAQKADYQRQQLAYEWVQENIGQAIDLQKKQKTSGQKDLSSIISGSAKQAGVTISRVQPDRKGLGVWLEDTAYQKLLAWLLVLDGRFNLSIQQIRVDKGREEGRVKVYMHLAQ
ncbi:MAG: type II secretion system protein GspM [Endozoicomonas sp.]